MKRLLIITSLTVLLATACGTETLPTTSLHNNSLGSKIISVSNNSKTPTERQQAKELRNNDESSKELNPKDQQLVNQKQQSKQPSPTEKANLNKFVLDVINTYRNGSYPYLLNNDYKNYNGVTTNIAYQGDIIAKAHPSGNRASHCVGLTFEVFFKAMQQRNSLLGLPKDDFNGMNKQQLLDFMLTWYVANGNKTNSNLAAAVEKYGIGVRITNLEDAKPGDFIDLSRENNTGHAVVFIDWLKENGKIIGLKYWSTQQSTNGIGYKKEYFNIRNANGNKYGKVIKDKLYIARILPITEYKKF